MKKLTSALTTLIVLGSASNIMAHPGHGEGIHSYLHAEHLLILAGLAIVGWAAKRLYKNFKNTK